MSLMFNIKKYFLSLKYNSESKKRLPMYKLSFLDLQKEYNLIDDFEYELETTKVLNQDKSEIDKQLAELEIKYKFKKIDNIEYIKRKNDIQHKPWVAIKTKYDEDNNPDNLEVEVVYNRTFIEKMRQRGLPGDTDEEIVDQWLKIFFIANLEEDDLSSLFEDDEPQDIKKQTKLNGKTTLIM